MSFWDDFSSMLGFSNPSDAAAPYLQKIGEGAHEGYDPYVQQGQQAYGQMSGPLGQMTSDPSGYMNQLMAGYSQSPQAKTAMQEALRAARGSAAAGGMAGTNQDVLGEARLADSMSQQDMQNYLQNVMGAQGMGLAGEQNIYNTGFGASQQLTDTLSNMYGSQATNAYKGAENQGKFWGDVAGLASKAIFL